jgi:hypothetical protein
MIAGCQKADDGLSADQQKITDRLDEIAKKTGGDWEKLNDVDKKYLVTELGHGNETSARMILSAKGGKLRVGPDGPKHP